MESPDIPRPKWEEMLSRFRIGVACLFLLVAALQMSKHFSEFGWLVNACLGLTFLIPPRQRGEKLFTSLNLARSLDQDKGSEQPATSQTQTLSTTPPSPAS